MGVIHSVKGYSSSTAGAKDRSSMVCRVCKGMDCLEAAVGRLFASRKLFYGRYMIGATPFIAVSAKNANTTGSGARCGVEQLWGEANSHAPALERTRAGLEPFGYEGQNGAVIGGGRKIIGSG